MTSKDSKELSGPPVLQWLKRSLFPASPSMGALDVLSAGISPARLVQQMSLDGHHAVAEPLHAGESASEAPGGLWLTSDVDAPLMLANLRESMTMQALPGAAQQASTPPNDQIGQLPAMLPIPKPAIAAADEDVPATLLASVKPALPSPMEATPVPSPRQKAVGREARHRAPVAASLKGRNNAQLRKSSLFTEPLAWERPKAANGKQAPTAKAATTPALRDRRRKP